MRASLIPLLLVVACGAPKPQPSQTPSIPAHPANLIPGQWNEIPTGGDTICSDGSPYSFFVYPGSSNKLVVDFIGGGACWTEESCSLGMTGLFSVNVDELKQTVTNGYPGIYDKSVPGPLDNWWHVILPYCTGDIHWGDADHVYGTGDSAFTIHHRGAVNTSAVLDWVYRNFAAPEKVFVTGCSAGSYGSIYWTPWIKQHFSEAIVSQMGDSGAGIVTDSFFKDSFPIWNATAHAPAWIAALDPAKVDYLSLALPDLYARVGAFYPDMLLSQVNAVNDGTQKFFYKAMGGNEALWSKKMVDSISRIRDTTPNFRSYLWDSDQHCVITNNDYTTVSSDAVNFIDWMTEASEGQPVQDVTCSGASCDPR